MVNVAQKLTSLGYKSEKIVCIQSMNVIGEEILSLSKNGRWIDKDEKTLKLVPELRTLIPEGILTLNLSTASIVSANVRDIEIASEACGKGKLVIEWVENNDSKEMVDLASKMLRRWRSKFNLMIAIDDYGTGQDGLERFLLTQPDIVKLNGDLLIKARTIKSYQRAISFICKWCQEENSISIIEWIERKEDLKIAIDCGANLGQGFYFK